MNKEETKNRIKISREMLNKYYDEWDNSRVSIIDELYLVISNIFCILEDLNDGIMKDGNN
jgi:hypothetical protein